MNAISTSENSSLVSLGNVLVGMNASGNEGDLDLSLVTNTWEKWKRDRAGEIKTFEEKILQNSVHIASLEARLKQALTSENVESDKTVEKVTFGYFILFSIHNRLYEFHHFTFILKSWMNLKCG